MIFDYVYPFVRQIITCPGELDDRLQQGVNLVNPLGIDGVWIQPLFVSVVGAEAQPLSQTYFRGVII